MGEPLNTVYILYFQIRVINALLLGIIWFLYLKNKRLPFEKGNFFNQTLVAISANMVCDIMSTYSLLHFNTTGKIVWNPVHRLFLLTMCMSVYYIHLHITSLCGQYNKSHTRINLLISIPFITAAAAGLFAPLEFHAGGMGAYLCGTAVNATFVVMGIYLVLSIICLVINYRHLRKKNTGNVIAGLVICAGFCIVQVLNPSILLSSTGLIILELMNYFNFDDSSFILIMKLAVSIVWHIEKCLIHILKRVLVFMLHR